RARRREEIRSPRLGEAGVLLPRYLIQGVATRSGRKECQTSNAHMCVITATLPSVPIRIAKTSRDRRRKITQDAPRGSCGAVVLAAWGVIGRSSSRLPVWKRRLLAAVACGALPLPGLWASSGPAWGQVSETLPEVTVTAPRPAPRPPRRPELAPRRPPPPPSHPPAPPPPP